ncbi:MAG: hypothetical protein E6R08_01005 [Nevskiaceae bacterium]|nr:MAG: hypothetical protein E6R08_01005 [Nevskiaceae bacterium]
MSANEKQVAVADLLMDLACTSAGLRLGETLGRCPEHGDEAWRTRKHPWIQANDNVLHAMRALGTAARNSGQDIRVSPYWSLLNHRDAYLEAYERHRDVHLMELTPRALYDCMSRGNVAHWAGWKVTVGGTREVTDGFGMPAFEERVWLAKDNEHVTMLSGVTKETARNLYAEIEGHEFSGPCDLGEDPPHPAETCW